MDRAQIQPTNLDLFQFSQIAVALIAGLTYVGYYYYYRQPGYDPFNDVNI